jgi:NAD(P)-dependent dehydrogenase (short-subunit alcohol dehydrogenase family)
MVERGSGSIVNIASVDAVRVAPGHAAYAATKAGLAGLARGVCAEYRKCGIRCNTVAPAGVNTAMLQGSRRATQSNGEPWIEPGEVADVVLFLLSEMSARVNGTTLMVDDGASASRG